MKIFFNRIKKKYTFDIIVCGLSSSSQSQSK